MILRNIKSFECQYNLRKNKLRIFLGGMEMKKIYEEPKLEIVEFVFGDIITDSPGEGFEGEEDNLEYE